MCHLKVPIVVFFDHVRLEVVGTDVFVSHYHRDVSIYFDVQCQLEEHIRLLAIISSLNERTFTRYNLCGSTTKKWVNNYSIHLSETLHPFFSPLDPGDTNAQLLDIGMEDHDLIVLGELLFHMGEAMSVLAIISVVDIS